jgi:membrane protein implicated in regulation of membrane protease activity
MIETDQLSLLFIGCFLLGFLYLLVTSLFGGLGHHLHLHTHTGHGATTQHAHTNASHFSFLSIINPGSIVLFLIGFGFFGYALHVSTSFTIPIILALACISGVIITALLLIALSRVFTGVETTTIQDVSDRTGLLGKVNITIQENGLGEMLYVSPGGMRKSVPARSIDGRRLERDQEVVVVNYQHGIAEVDTWDHFVNQEDTISAINPDSDDLATLRALLEEPEKTDSTYVIHNDSSKEQ